MGMGMWIGAGIGHIGRVGRVGRSGEKEEIKSATNSTLDQHGWTECEEVEYE